MKINREAFNRGVDDVFCLRPIRHKTDHFISWLYTRRIWGERCDGFEPDCPCCKAWAVHDDIFNSGD